MSSDSQMSIKQTALFFRNALETFSASQDAFRVLSRVPRTRPPLPSHATTHGAGKPSDQAVTKLIILDSSFNPPTKAHAQMASSALRDTGPGARLMLLLAVNNADKSVVPAPFDVRLGMMDGFARDLVRDHAQGQRGVPGPVELASEALEVDIAVTTLPYFHAKSAAIAALEPYGGAEQVFLCGFDTVVRILNPKYYGAGAMKQVLGPFFRRARIRVTMRDGDEWGSEEEQAAYGEGLERELASSGGDGHWARRIELVKGVQGAISSSMVRATVTRSGDEATGRLEGLVGGQVERWICEERLYRE
ncbi:Rossmann-like alpha/beta/alpha sandwich fold protein [Metarhizium rileyi]|uniref:Rossmann-like alpha/beta/alpha sandwich fold protein n=1 Tax=Metarhizium rileyi (strain RCEF 4871) TaxID=1649241 RepID=A0A166Z869_METRR|nr:Rossmann-like alpha/beta/alpha sandwich fold protein [Metarhizium rileyi RCEF 4871]